MSVHAQALKHLGDKSPAELDPAGYVEPSDELKRSMQRVHAVARPTPGPWNAPHGTTTVWSANGDVLIAECRSRHLSYSGNVANAKLVALGPNLVEALELLLPYVDDAAGVHQLFPESAAATECRIAVAYARMLIAQSRAAVEPQQAAA